MDDYSYNYPGNTGTTGSGDAGNTQPNSWPGAGSTQSNPYPGTGDTQDYSYPGAGNTQANTWTYSSPNDAGNQYDDYPAYIPNVNININIAPNYSFFDGGLFQLVGYRILGALVTALTFGICFPWAFTMVYRWEARHTVVDGYRLYFDGTAAQLFGNWIIWLVLSILTCGIYGFWVGIKLRQWKALHTHIAGPA